MIDWPRVFSAIILQAVQAFIQENGRPPVVLDIGCGTGLLSMLAVRGGATEVIGCELYEPLAQVAREITELNCEGRIQVGFPPIIHFLCERSWSENLWYNFACDFVLPVASYRYSLDPSRAVMKNNPPKDLFVEVPRRYVILSGPPSIRRSA